MNKEDLFKNIRPQFKYLFPEYQIRDNHLDIIYDVATLDTFVKRTSIPNFYELFWSRVFLNTFRAYEGRYSYDSAPYSYETYINIYDNIIKKYNPIDFKC